jgi:coproporphyrinogen III oxidase-like Fe-S oxidoreductase
MRWNISNNAMYISGIQNGTPTFTEEILSTVDIVNELLLTQLRLTKGVNIQQINHLYPGFEELKRPIIEKLIGNFQIVEQNGHWSIPSAARFLADAITVELMLDEN